MTDELKKGLEGVLVAASELSHVDGDAGRLIYRGYSIEDLSNKAAYEEVVYLLWHGDLPTQRELDEFTDRMTAERDVHDDVFEVIRVLAEADEHPMAALRTATSMLSAFEPLDSADPEDLDAALEKGRRVTAKIPTVLAAYDRVRNGHDPVDPRDDLGHAANFLYMLNGDEPRDVATKAFDKALTLHVDHGLNASTFAALVIASTFADMYNAVIGGIGALSGSLHGGANQDVMEVLYEIDESEMDPLEWIETAIDNDRRIPGWGHRVYNVKDPRSKILQAQLEELSEVTGETKWLEYATTIERYLTDQVGLPERGIAPNVDFYSGSVYQQLGIPIDLYTPIFAMSRVGGWVGHVLEYQADNRLIRPRARYTGPLERDWIPIDERE